MAASLLLELAAADDVAAVRRVVEEEKVSLGVAGLWYGPSASGVARLGMERRLRRRLRRELEELIGGAHRGQLSLAIRVRIILSSSRVVIVSSGSLESRSPLSIHPVLGVLRP